MTLYKRILCPVDLSDNSLAAVELASTLANQHSAKLIFLYVAPQWLPEDALFGDDYIRGVVAADKKRLLEIRPTETGIECEHLTLNGNPSPEIVRAAEIGDVIVMSTHGQTGLLRLLVGSVTRYVLRHAPCPVITFQNSRSAKKDTKAEETPTKETESIQSEPKPQRFVTALMHHVDPIHRFDKMENVIAALDRAKETAAPVINDMGGCIGILTKSDIDKFRDLLERFKKRDPSVVSEMFEVDEFGQRRPGNDDFDQVHRHMTSPVVTIANSETCQKAIELFEANQDIHHLLVVDDLQHPIGILELQDLKECENLSSEA
jgi:nucleotide-binding universal stress UspA family protein/CBS domain-containing protein